MVKKFNKKKTDGSWKAVKIEGNVISINGEGLEGLMGLEVLENYDKNLVQHSKKIKRQSIEIGSISKKYKIADDSDCIINLKEENEKRCPKRKKKKQIKTADHIIENHLGTNVLFKPSAKPSSEEETKTGIRLAKERINARDLIHWNGFGIPQPILEAIAELGFKSPTPIQSLTLPAAIMGKKDIVGAAETGSGKTLAFGIPILSGILELKHRNSKTGIRKVKYTKEERDIKQRDNLTPPPEQLDNYPETENNIDDLRSEKKEVRPLYALVLTPTRELAVQVRDHIAAAAKYTDIKVVAIFGGMASIKQERILRHYPEIIVATPGRMWELLEMGNTHLNQIDDISFLVIDETDRMIEKGHFEEFHKILERLNSDVAKKERRQNFIFSATLTLVHDMPDHLQRKNISRNKKFKKQTAAMKIQSLIDFLGISQPKIVDITCSSQTAQSLTECRLICPIDEKDFYLYYFLQKHPGRTIVFCNSIGCVKRLAKLFGLLDCQPLPLHANMVQKQRLKNLERFRVNRIGLLVATDVAARGLDIPDVQHVIHYQVPRTSENYVHRSGRTARANKTGVTIMFMEPGEVKNYLKLRKTLKRSEDLPLFPVSERHLNAVKARVNLARQVDKLELKLKREMSELSWLKKSAADMDIVLDHEAVSNENNL